MTYDFITIGGATRDISFFTDQGVFIKNPHDILRQQLLAFELGAKIKVDKFFYSYGGGAANAAACLSNFRFKTACLAAVGRDSNGDLIIENLKARQIDVHLVERIKDGESGASFILISPSGERIIFGQRGSNRSLIIKPRDFVYLKKTKNIYIASLSGDWLGTLKSIFSVVTGSDKDPNIFWNPGMTQLLGGADKIKKYLKKTTVLACNKDEALELILNTPRYKNIKRQTLNDTEKIIKIIHSFGAKIVVITMGGEGVMAFDGQKIYRQKVVKEKKRVDTTGVGDIFNSSFAAGWTLFGGDISKALLLGAQNAATKVAHVGAQNSLIKI
jgi:sugar/nucleoside kinase (ribokinase family)